MMAIRFREFKFELHAYFMEFASIEEALAEPPRELVGRPEQWEFLCQHFQSERFLVFSFIHVIILTVISIMKLMIYIMNICIETIGCKQG